MKSPLNSFLKSGRTLKLTSALFTSAVIATVVYATANIPAGCTTPGDCDAISPAFQSATLEGDLIMADNDASNTVTITTPADITANYSLTLPTNVGTLNQVLTTDGSGVLSWGSISTEMDITGLTTETVIANNDTLAIYDISAGANRKITRANFLAGILGAVVYQGAWDASGNSPALADGTGTQGNYYIVSTAGNKDLGSGNLTLTVGDWVIHNGAEWEKLDNVNDVQSVFGRIGVITASAGDYAANQITNTPAGNIAATNVQTAINELDTEKQTLDAALTDISNIMSAEGDFLYFDGTNWVKLGIGTAGQVLTTNGGATAPEWAAAGGGSTTFTALTDTDITGVSAGATLYFDGTNWIDLPKGTAGQKLAMNTGATAPEWVTDSTSSTSLETFYEALTSDYGGTSSGIEDLGISYTITKDGRYLVTVYGDLQVRGNDIFAYVRATDASNNLYQGTEFRVQLGDQSVASDYRKEFSGSATAILELSAGDVVKLRGNETGASDFLAGTSLTVQQLPTTAGVGVGGGGSTLGSVSARVGEFIHAKSGSFSLGDGYLPVSPGTIANGAVSYPVWAGKYPEFVSGNDIVFPADVAGMFLRNLGGNAGTEGVSQAYRTALPANNFTTDDPGNHNHGINGNTSATGSGESSVSSGGFDRDYNTKFAGNHTHDITGGGDIETNPLNRAYQLYTIIDTYNQVIEASALPTSDNAASGYMDIGDMRMQWGVVAAGNNTSITLPAAMSDANYSVVATSESNRGSVDVNAKTSTNFTINHQGHDNQAALSGSVNWQVMGLKP